MNEKKESNDCADDNTPYGHKEKEKEGVIARVSP